MFIMKWEGQMRFPFRKNLLHSTVKPIAHLFYSEIQGFITNLLSVFYVWGIVLKLGDTNWTM